jgi:hypothetical protein
VTKAAGTTTGKTTMSHTEKYRKKTAKLQVGSTKEKMVLPFK